MNNQSLYQNKTYQSKDRCNMASLPTMNLEQVTRNELPTHMKTIPVFDDTQPSDDTKLNHYLLQNGTSFLIGDTNIRYDGKSLKVYSDPMAWLLRDPSLLHDTFWMAGSDSYKYDALERAACQQSTSDALRKYLIIFENDNEVFKPKARMFKKNSNDVALIAHLQTAKYLQSRYDGNVEVENHTHDTGDWEKMLVDMGLNRTKVPLELYVKMSFRYAKHKGMNP